MFQASPGFERAWRVAGLVIVFIAILLDLAPLLILLIFARNMTIAERIRRLRRWWFDVREVMREGQGAEGEMIRVRFKDQGTVSAVIRVYPGALVEDVKRDLASLVSGVRRETGLPITVTGLTNVFGQRLSDSLPLLDQLGDQRVVVVSYVLLKRR